MGLPKKLKNFVLFVDGNSYAGEVPEVTLPKLTRKTDEFRAGGMNAPVDLDYGMEKIEFEWKSAGWSVGALSTFGSQRHDAALLRFVGGVQSDDSEEVTAVEVTVRGRHTEIDHGNPKAGEATEISYKTSCSYYKLTVAGEVVIEIDIVNMVEVVNGEDRMAQMRAALGL